MSDLEDVRVLQAIQEVYEAHLEESSADVVVDRLLEHLLELSASREGFVWEVPGPQQRSTHAVARANSAPHLEAWAESLCAEAGSVLTEPRVIDASTSGGFEGLQSGATPAPQSMLLLPLRHGGKVSGVAGLVDFPEGESGSLANRLEPLLAAAARVLQSRRAVHGGESGRGESHDSETALRHMQKADAIGTLASAVAHDLNNVLYVMLGNAELGMKKGGDGNPLAKYFADILAAARRGVAVTERLLVHRRISAYGEPWCDLASAMEEAREFLPTLLPPSIQVVFEGAPVDAVVPLAAPDLHQILLDLCWNAVRATASEGMIQIRVDASGDPQGTDGPRFVRITVSDQGEGMPEPLLECAFDPGFTTKPAGKGAGLGLSVVRGIVTAAGGTVALASGLGRGTEVEIELPCGTSERSSDP